MSKPYYLTTPLYYVNAKPHIGHAYTNILCDTFARFHKFLGEEVFFLTGTDEHGTKIDKAAKELNKEPKVYVDEMVPQFKALWKTLGIEYDYFIRTTDAGHKKIVQNILLDLEKKGDIYKASYKGWYCTPCESFWTKLQLAAVYDDRSAEGKCPDCKRDVQELSEENYFFKLSKYQKDLKKYIEDHPDFIRPEIRKNEILGFLREPLEDLCITRPRARLSWGIDYPSSKDHVVYVWFDALVNYVSATRFPAVSKKFPSLWPADIHVVGKDILRQHAVYWPIMLKAMGVEMPKIVFAHGWWTMSGAKVSKSRGNAVDPVELVNKYGVDAFRYFLLNEVTLGLDGAFSEDLLAERYTSDLANDLGNLWFRLASMLDKYFEGKIPESQDPLSANPKSPLIRDTLKLWDVMRQAMVNYDPRSALAEIWAVITSANRFIEEKKPWVVAKNDAQKGELADVLSVLAECLARIACLLQIFLPQTAHAMLKRLKLKTNWAIPAKDYLALRLLKPGTLIEKGEALFPRLDDAVVK